MPTRHIRLLVAFALVAALASCAPGKVKLFPDYTEPLQETTLEGDGENKILLIPVQGILKTESDPGLFASKPSIVQEVVSHLEKAAEDPTIKAILLVVNSPGGSATASDVLYHELSSHRKRTGQKIVASMMGMAASGGYYACLAADHIMAHPTTVTGSVGTIFVQPKVVGLMDKIGVEVAVYKSGRNKDMGSFFRDATETERAMLQEIIDGLNSRFVEAVRENRSLSGEALNQVATARVYTAAQARAIGLVDSMGYLDDAKAKARELAGLSETARVVVYRRRTRANDNAYNPITSMADAPAPLIDLSALTGAVPPSAGFYHLFAPGY